MQRGVRRRSSSSAPRATATASPRCPPSRRSQDINPQSVEEADVFALHEEAGQFCIAGVLLPQLPELGQPRLFPQRRPRRSPTGEVLGAFLAQFYDDKPAPRLVLLSHEIEERDLLAEALSDPRRAPGRDRACRSAARRRDLVEHAAQNAREALGRRLADTSSQQQAAGRARRGLRPGRRRSAASRSTTTPTSWAPTPSARWSWPAPQGFSKTALPHVQHPARPSSRPATTSA